MPSIITVTRKWQTESSTISEFFVPGAKENELQRGFFLERPGPDTTESGLRLRIPEGIYQLQWQNRTTLPGVRPHLPVPWIVSNKVPANRWIYIHNGNYPNQTDGCLLIGETHAEDFVGRSVSALRAFKRYLDRVGIASVRLNITSDYQ
ncbi:DUF5675 family protein [uncultured Marinobacter sp.]|uniref:DUF5675 family protein n=1 Tax=uncultured Marinobacter sp. TaxID=187379 RepID=UPI0030DB7DA2